MRNIIYKNNKLITTLIHFNYNKIMSSMLSTSSKEYSLSLDKFCSRQFNNPDYTGTQIHYDPIEFERIVNELYDAGSTLVDGYAPFW
jgi:hypothetical protein